MSVDITKEHRTRKPDANFQILSISMSVVLFCVVGVICWQTEKVSGDWGWLFSAVILTLPLLQIPILIYMLRKDAEFWGRGALLLLHAMGLEVLLWIVFMFRKHSFFEGNSWLDFMAGLGLFAALGLGGLIVWITSLIMGLADGRGDKYKNILREQPFLIVCFFLTIFTLITLFLSLSLALHDQDLRLNHDGYALYSEDLGVYEEGGGQPSDGVQAKSVDAGGPLQAENAGIPEMESKDLYFRLLFAKGSATVEVLPEPLMVPEESHAEEPSQNDPDQVRKEHNTTTVDKLVKAMAALSKEDHVRIVLVGHSDDLRVNETSGSYGTNFELSQVRINQAMVTMLSVLGTRGGSLEWRRKVEWIFLPCGDGKTFLGDVGTLSAEQRRSVEIALLPADGDRFSHVYQLGGKDLGLLDYIYFMVYTITTTGYGDIIPISSYAKFLTTVANFFEVFLIVVFFNVLLSFLRENSGPLKSGGTPANT